MSPDAIVAPPEVCGSADLQLAHQQMQHHRDCRVDRCAWKTAAFSTLFAAGHITPQTMTPRQRAALRGIPFPPLDTQQPHVGSPTPGTLREVLHRLTAAEQPTTQTPTCNCQLGPDIDAGTIE